MELIKNPDTQFCKTLKNRIKDNGGYCLNKPKGNPDNKCKCLDMREKGECACGLYVVDPTSQWDGEG